MEVLCTEEITIDVKENKLSPFWKYIRGTWVNGEFSHVTIGGSSGGMVNFSEEELPKLIEALNEIQLCPKEE